MHLQCSAIHGLFVRQMSCCDSIQSQKYTTPVSLLENSHSSSGTICMRNRVEVGGTIRNYLELICRVTPRNVKVGKFLDRPPPPK